MRNKTPDGTQFGYSYHLPSGGSGVTTRIRNGLSQFSDLFSEFDKFIAPAYHHDRCERSVHMRLYSMHKREFVLVFIVFFACFGLALLVGIAGPPITSTVEIDARSLLTNTSTSIANDSLATGPFLMKTPTLTTYSQQLWLIAKVWTDNKDDEVFDKRFYISISIDGLNEEHKPVTVVDNTNTKNRTRHLMCTKRECDEFVVLHLGIIEYSHYIIAVKFFGLGSFHKRYNINRLVFYMKTYNPAFTQLEIGFRCIFLTATALVTCWLLYNLRRFALRDWSIEQKWMALLLPLLMGFNNPLFPMTFLVDSWFPGMLDALAQITFLAALLLFWLCIYHGLRQNERKILTYYMPKIFIVAILWIQAAILACWQKFSELRDPTYNHTVDTSNFYTLKAFFFIFGTIYLIYLATLILRAYTDLRSMPFFGLRLKFLTMQMFIVISITAITTISRFGVGIVEDNFVAHLSTKYSSSVHFMSFYGMLNLYIYTMAYVYAPTNQAAHEFTITKDNPSFSMITDSDEEDDVIYASDFESRKPLNRGNDDDSD